MADILLSILLFTSCSLVLANKQPGNGTCEVGVLLVPSSEDEELVKLDGGPIPGASELTNCDDEDRGFCEQIVSQEVETAMYETRGGNLTSMFDSREGYNLGDFLCDKAEVLHNRELVRNQEVRFYWRYCGSDWTKTDYKMKSLLCCEDGLYIPCEDFKLKDEL